MQSSARQCPSSGGRSLDAETERQRWLDRQGWLKVVSTGDWIMALPHDPDYISPFNMQGCICE